MKKQTIDKKKTLQNFFSNFYILIFACVLLVAAAVKMAFTLSTKNATGTWKVILVADTITAVLSAATLFVFYMSGDGKSKGGLKTSSIMFLVSSSASIITQFFVLTYFATFDNIILLFLIFIAFSVQTIFQLFFAITITRSVLKNTFITTGALPFAAFKAASVVFAVLVYTTDTSVVNLELFKSPLIATNMLSTVYPQLAFFTFIATSLTFSAFALLYNKYAEDAKKNEEECADIR